MIDEDFYEYHDLYSHKCMLWINLCLIDPDDCFLVQEYCSGFFLLGMVYDKKQITYQCPNRYLYLVQNIIKEDNEHIFDGHTSSDVIDRLIEMAKDYN